MNPKSDYSVSTFVARTFSVLCLGMAVAALSADAGKGVTNEMEGRSGFGSVVVMDAAAFGSSAGQASIKSAPTTWSSRSTVRFNARWASDARYVV